MKTEDIAKVAGQTAVGAGTVYLGMVGTTALASFAPIAVPLALIGGGGYLLGQYMFGETNKEEQSDDE